MTGPDANGVYSATYTVTATNTGTAATTYQLWDKAQYGPDIEVVGAEWNGQRTGSATAAQIAGDGHFELAPENTSIAANASHTYNVTIRFKVNGVGYNPETCEANNGLFNLAVVKDGAAGTGYQDDDCMPVPSGPTFKLEKRPSADQDPNMAGDQSVAVIAGNGNVTSFYDVIITNNSAEPATPAAPITDTLTPPPGFAVTRVTATIGGNEVATATGPAFEIAPDRVGEIPGGGTKTIRVKVEWSANDDAANAIADGGEAAAPYVCESPTPGNADTPRGLFNAVAIEGEDEGDNPGANNQACVTPVVTPVSVSKSPRPGDPINANPDGSANLVYTVTVRNESPDLFGYSKPIVDRILLPGYVTATRDATIEQTQTNGVTVNGAVATWAQADIVGGAELPIASGVVLPGGASQTFTITIPVKVTANGEQWAEIAECRTVDGGFTGGALNGVAMDRDATENDDVACIPIIRAPLPGLTINKVDIDNQTTTLDGADFDLYAANPEGEFDPAAQPIGKADGSTLRWENLEPGTYYVVETRSPDGYQLLPQPVGIEISAVDTSYSIRVFDEDAAVAQPVMDMTGDGYELIVQVNDIKTGNLPLTGPRDQAFWYALALMVGLGMIAMNLGLFRRER